MAAGDSPLGGGQRPPCHRCRPHMEPLRPTKRRGPGPASPVYLPSVFLATCPQLGPPRERAEGKVGGGGAGSVSSDDFLKPRKETCTHWSQLLPHKSRTHTHTHTLLSNSVFRDTTVDSLKPAMMEGLILPKWVIATSRDFFPESQLINIHQHPTKHQPGVLSPSPPDRPSDPVHSADPRSRVPRELQTPRATEPLVN